MALVQPMLKALRENNQKEIDRYEDITDILMKEISSDIDIKSMPSAKLPAARAFARVHNEVLEYFIKLKKKPEKVEKFIEQAYQETKSSDFAVIADRVYDLVKQDESETRETSLEEMPKAVLKGKDYEALVEAGMVDNEQWLKCFPAGSSPLHFLMKPVTAFYAGMLSVGAGSQATRYVWTCLGIQSHWRGICSSHSE